MRMGGEGEAEVRGKVGDREGGVGARGGGYFVVDCSGRGGLGQLISPLILSGLL